MQELGTIGQAFYMRAFFHFANLYDGRHRSQLSFQKRYDDICTEWLGGLTMVKHKSKIADRLGSHLDQLVERQFLAGYRIAKAKGERGFVISFKPGEGFFRDYDRFYRSRLQGELQWDYTADQRSIAEPLRVAYLFIEKRTGQKVGSQAYVGSKEVETAKQLLTELAFDEISGFFDYALREAQRSNFDVQSLGGIRQYLAGYRAATAARKAAAQQEALLRQRQRGEDELAAYEIYRRSEAKRIFETLSPADREGIETEACQKAATFKGSLQDMMIARRRDQIVADRHSAEIGSFEAWKASRLAAYPAKDRRDVGSGGKDCGF